MFAIFIPANNDWFDGSKLINLVESLYIYIVALESKTKLSLNR
jgi:hypothetical protein